MILKAVPLISIAIGGLCSLAQAYHLLPAPDIMPLVGWAGNVIVLSALSGLIHKRQSQGVSE